MMSISESKKLSSVRKPQWFGNCTKNGAPINLVHLNDVIGIIHTILEDETAAGIFNVTSPDHPTREAFYTLAARYLAMEPPVFIHEKAAWKTVESVRIVPELHYKFQIPDLLKWLNDNPEL